MEQNPQVPARFTVESAVELALAIELVPELESHPGWLLGSKADFERQPLLGQTKRARKRMQTTVEDRHCCQGLKRCPKKPPVYSRTMGKGAS